MGDGNERQGAGGLIDPHAGAIRILRETRRWVRFVSSFGFLCSALIGLLGAASLAGMAGGQVHAAAWLLYPAFVALHLVPSIQLFKYARRIDTFVAQGHMVQLEAALEAQRVFWRFAGIVVVVSAGAGVFVFAAAMLVGIVAGL